MLRRVAAGLTLVSLTAAMFVSCDGGLEQCALPCERDEDCQFSDQIAQSRCESGRCYFVTCVDDSDCPSGESCLDLEGGRACAEACNTDADCSSEQSSCYETINGEKACLNDCRKGGCIEEETCDEATGTCYCTDDSSCFGGVCE